MSLDQGPDMTEDSKQRNRLVSALAEHEQLRVKDMVDDRNSSGNAGAISYHVESCGIANL